MVMAPDDTEGVPGEEIRKVMENGTFEDERGQWMRRTLYDLLEHPQVRQYYDELRCLVQAPTTWKEVEHRFSEILIEMMDEPEEKLLESLRNTFKCLTEDDPKPLLKLLGVPQPPSGPSPEVVKGPLAHEYRGVEIRYRTELWVGQDGGVFVGRSKPGRPGCVIHEDFGRHLDRELFREALLGKPLYVDEGEEDLAIEVVQDFNLARGPEARRVDWQAEWLKTWQRLLGHGVSLSYTGVALKLMIRSRPGSLGNFSRLFKCCALRNFQGHPAELLPMALPDDTTEEQHAFGALVKAAGAAHDPSDEDWSADEKSCEKAGIAAWSWLQVLGVNALYLGGGTDRCLSTQMAHSCEWSPGQQALMSRAQELAEIWLEKGEGKIEIGEWDKISQSLDGIYTGPEVKKAYPLTVEGILPTTPAADEAGRIELAEVVAPELKSFVLNPELLRIPDDELINPRTFAKVHVDSDEEWNRVVAHLVKAGMLEREDPHETLRYKDEAVRNGAFGVHKGWQQREDGSFFRTLRLIINLIPSNGFQRKTPWRPSQKMGYSPLWGQMVVLEDEVVMSYEEDQRHCFHIYRPGSKWRGYFVLSKKAAGWAFADSSQEASYPRVKTAPMGWSNVVDFIQSGLEMMGTQAGMSIKHAVRLGDALPALPLDTPRTYYSWYVDNWDSFKIVAKSDMGEYEGKPSDDQLKLRAVFKLWDVGRDPKKAAEGTLSWSSLGAEVDGARGLVGSNTKFRRGILGATINLLQAPWIRTDSQELQALVSKHMHTVQFCRPLASAFDHLYREVANPGGGRNLNDLARDELLLLSSLLPQHWINQRHTPSGTVFATDASEEGGGACQSTGLSEWGHQRCHGLSYAENGLEGSAADDLLVVEMFAGMGGLKQALELIGMVPQGIISIDTDPTSKKLSRAHCRDGILYDDVKTITKEMVVEWRRQFPRARRILLAGGWPCIHHSSLNANRQGAAGATSQLLDEMMKIRSWIKEASAAHGLPSWELLEFYENVVMDKSDLEVQSEKIGWLPMHVEAADVGRCRRPRLYWVKGIQMINGSDLKVEQQAKIRDLEIALDKGVIKTEIPPLDWFLNKGAKKLSQENEPFYTCTRPIMRKEPPPSPAGLERASPKALQRWRGDSFRLPPYAYENANLVTDKSGPRRLLPDEQLRMMGYTSSHLTLKSKLTNDQKGHFIGNSFSAIVVARLLTGLALDDEQGKDVDLTKAIWESWRSLEDQVGREQQPWRTRFGQGPRAGQGVVAMRRRVLPPADLPLKAKLDPQNRLTDEELLAYMLTRQAVQKGCDIRVDLNQPFSYGTMCRHSIDPGNWRWKVLLSYQWKKGGQHINVLEATAILDLARKLAREPKHHGMRSILLVDNIVSLSVIAKGRSSARSLQAPLRRLTAVLLAADLRFYLGWVKSSWNPADGPSRWKAKL